MSHYEFRKQIALAWIDPTTYWKDRMKNKQQKKPPTTCSTETESRPSRKRSQSVSVASAQSIGGGVKREQFMSMTIRFAQGQDHCAIG